MSLEIDPDSINLGKTDPKYFAEYVNKAAATTESNCVLPDAITFTLPELKLIDLDPSCVYEFPDTLGIPPTYYPPPIKPFPACEKFGATADVQFLNLAAKNSFLIIEANGPVKPEESGDDALTDNAPNDCSLKVTGKFDIEACDKVTTTTAVNFGENLTGSLNLVNVEDCGVALVGDIQYDGCPYYDVKNNVSFAPLFAGSSLSVTPNNSSPCSLTIDGFFDADVCEEFGATNTINISGNIVKNQKSTLNVRDKNPCGYDFAYSAEIVACDKVNVDGSVTVKGDSRFVKINKPISLIKGNDAPNCSLELAGDIEIVVPNPGCKELKYTDTSTIYGRSVVEVTPKYYTVLPSSDNDPVCGVTIGGATEIQACPTYPTTYYWSWRQVKELVSLKLPVEYWKDPVAVAKYNDAIQNGNVYGPYGAVPGSSFEEKTALNINFVNSAGQIVSQQAVQGLKYSAPPVIKQVSTQQNYAYPACGSVVQNSYYTDICSEVYLDFPYTPQQMSTITIYGPDGSVGRGGFKISAAAENAPGTPKGCGKSVYLMATKNIDIFMDYDDNGDGSGDIYGGDATGGVGSSGPSNQNSSKGLNGGPCNFGCFDEGASGAANGLVWNDKQKKWVPYNPGASGALGATAPLIRPYRKKNLAVELRDMFVNNIYPAQAPCCTENGMMIDMCKGSITGLKKIQIARQDGKLWEMPTVPAGAEPKWTPIMMCDGAGKKRIMYVLSFPEPTKQNWYEGATGAAATFTLKDGVRGYYDQNTKAFVPYGGVGATSFSGAVSNSGASGASSSTPSWSNPGDRWDNPFAGIA